MSQDIFRKWAPCLSRMGSALCRAGPAGFMSGAGCFLCVFLERSVGSGLLGSRFLASHMLRKLSRKLGERRVQVLMGKVQGQPWQKGVTFACGSQGDSCQ